MSYGTTDTYTPRGVLQHNARGLGLPPVMPVLPGEDYGTASILRPVSKNVTGGDGQARTAACFMYAPDGYDGHFVATRNAAAIADWTAFLESFLATGTPTIP
jgi:hypothetical protein